MLRKKIVRIAVVNRQSRIRIAPALVRRIIRAVFLAERARVSGEVTVCLVGDCLIQQLNKQFLASSRPTDVIAFNLSGNRACLVADIVVSADTAVRHARLYKTTPLYELTLYIVHGVLHVLGYDDATALERKRMQRRAESILNQCLSLKRKPLS